MKYPALEDEDVVISGIGCRLPECDSMEEFAEKLFAGQNLVTRDDRKLSQGLFENLPEFSGKIRDTRRFDYTFFGISNIVVQCMDPMTQQIIERTFEAVMDAGINPAELRGTETAVYSASSISDFDLEWATNYKGGYGIMGRNRCMNANRVSYWLDLKGTSMSIDSNWANGLVNIQNGWEAIKKGRCDTAIVSTANIQSNAEITIQLNDMGFLSPNGICNSFDDSANGYTRSDAVVVFVLQRASIARRSYATIVHVDSKCFGDKNNILQKPLQEHWEEFLEEFYSKSKIDINEIAYLEGHGSGIKDEDTAELKAITKFFGNKRKSPLLLGSVKSNMGHAEASAASCGVIKAIIALERGIIPQNLNFTTPNSEASTGFQSGKLKIVDRNVPLTENGLIAVNAQSCGGTYSHIVLKACGNRKNLQHDGIPRLVLISGRTSDLIDNVITKFESVPFDLEYINLINTINSKKVDKYLGRGYTILPKKDNPIHEHQAYNEMKRPVWFIFSGMGSQWPTMAKRLMDLPIFRESIERSHRILEAKGLDLIKIVTEKDPKIFDNILHSFVGIAAVQIALVDILNALQIIPDGMIGHSVGELGCAYADGCFTAEQMIMSAYSRGMASIESNLINGYMAAVGKGYNQIKDELPEGIEVACRNASDSCTISGPAELVQEYVKELESKGVFAKTVNVSNIAYHSKYIKPAAPRLLKYLKDVIPKPKLRSSKWISTSNTEDKWDTELAKYCSAEYHTNNLLSSVLFEDGCKHIPSDAICIEIAPHGLLQAILKRSLGQECTNIPLTRRGTEDALIFLFQAIGKLYMAGLQPQVANIFPKTEFPVSKGTPSIHQLISWDHQVDLGAAQTRAEKKVTYSIKSHFLKTAPDGLGYIINGENTYPVAVFLHLVWSIFATLKKLKTDECAVVFENVRIECPMAIHTSKSDDAMITLQKGTGDFEINTTRLIARGTISMVPESALKAEDKETFSFSTNYTLSKEDVYNEFQGKGYDIGEKFKQLCSIDIGNAGWKGEIDVNANWIQVLESLFQIQVLQMGEESVAPKFPKSFEKLTIVPQHHLKNKSPQEPQISELIAYYDIIQNVIKCGAIKMKGLQVEELPVSKSTLKFTKRQFVPFMYPSLKDAWQFMNFCFSIVVDNMKTLVTENEVTVLEIENGKHGNSLQNYLEESFPQLKIKFQKVSAVKDVEPKKTFNFILSPVTGLEKCATLLAESGLILTRTDKNQPNKVPPGLVIVSKFTSHNDEEFWLTKKQKEDSEKEPHFIFIPKNEAMLTNLLNGITNIGHQVYLVGYEEPERGMENFMRRTQQETAIPLRWVFILQDGHSASTQSGDFYKNQIKNGLVTNIFCNGSWGFFLLHNYSDKAHDMDFISTKKLNKEISECYLGIDISRKFIELHQVEFSGNLKNGARTFGIASVSKDASIVPDKNYTWTLPESWSLEDGATVPLSYAYAYHCLITVGHLDSHESLFITDACTPVGMAMMYVGFSLVKEVYVTVSNEEEANKLTKLFPQLPRSHILFHTDKNVHIQLGIITKSNYPQVIVNQLEGERLMSTCNCLPKFGRMFHFGADDSKKNVQLGTSMFLLSTSFFSISQDLMSNLRLIEKQKIHELLDEGLKNGVVKPLPRRLFTFTEFQKLMREPEKIPVKEKCILSVEFANTTNNLEIDSDYSYLIIGDETEIWVDMMRCLIRKGARKIVVCHNGPGKRVERHAKIIKKFNIVLHEEKNILDIQNLFNVAQKLGPLGAVFVLALKRDATSKILADVDRIYRDKNGYLVVISKEGGTANEICVRRNYCGLPSTNFIWGAEETLIGREMDIVNKLCGTESVFRVSHTLEGALDSDVIGEMLRDVLPSTVQDFCKLGESLGNTVRLTELPTMMGLNRVTNEIAPMIFIGGLQNDPVEVFQPVARNLSYPVFCLHIPNIKMSLQKMVTFILPKIYELRKENNVFNLVGYSWGCYIAIEMSKQIEEVGGNVGLILIDCPPQVLKQNLSENKSWELNLLKSIQGISKTTEAGTAVVDKTFSMKVNRILSKMDLGVEEENHFREAVNFIHNNFSAAADYELDGIRLRGPLTVVRSGPQTTDERTLSKMCNCISVRSVDERSLASLKIREIIHGSAVAQSMSKNTVNLCSWRILEDFLLHQKASDFNSLTADFRVTATKLKFSFTH